ncbi:hypothetical protein C731_2960 [Mycolicibacterium hassiacum DSM 44199]|uniref:Uncharacterized protein n=1 Tax=Mycolicibacterium hassiacum (strain DSM 44199 / CIP 105218 / JCM 12690 / 3849) TaxID=1122247 RepID=K5BEJ2_MYCHD|nr:DUF6378 domain-containing protein [Mycolicibacterium hassiacum]EKF23062.1 hypothetical protein C731_2960 [Mycolicibacterium hassiacum DSM 44199]MDA4086056.1 hypothetical protein [Mycolicibacterium hassiacum DSM 44199]VCT89513.1 hypothetical protein MHAS_01207 [Mycolicibacterium hassiacum DSM 44199]
MSILTTAEEIINGQRAIDYGDARENHERIATLWGAYKRGTEFSPEDVAVMMILLKIARFMENGYHEDTVVDIAGYAGVLEKMQLPEDRRYAVAPRQWDRLEDIPDGVTVRDNEGDFWKRRGDDILGWLSYKTEADAWATDPLIREGYNEAFGPFTEVKEST